MPSVSRRYANARSRFDRPSGQPDESLSAPVVLMVSGGADSTALLVLAATSALDIDDGRGPSRIARERLHVLHVNHGLRGIDAEEDEEFVRDLSARYGVPCTIRRIDAAALAALNAESAATMDEVFSRADIVSLHLALNDATRGIIGPAQLDLMRPGALLVNTARAELIEPGAMLRRLSRGDIAAAIDVTAPEPLPDDDPLRTLPNLIITPHVAWRSDRALAALVEQNVRSAVEFLKGGAYNVIV